LNFGTFIYIWKGGYPMHSEGLQSSERLQETLITLKKVEEKAREELKKAREEADEILKKAREEADEILKKAREEAERIKQEYLAGEREKIEKDVEEILRMAREKAEKIKEIKADDDFLRELSLRLIHFKL